jgi:hypothetical protein
MNAFDHVILLLSFVYALALTHLLSRIGALFVARQRVKFSGPLALAMGVAIMLVYANWLGLWDLRDMKSWDLLSITTQFTFSVLVYFICILIGPEAGEGEIDMEAFYWRQYRPYYWTMLAGMGVSLAANAEFLKTPNTALFIRENLAVLPMFLPPVLALVVRARWAQWLAGIALLAMMIGFTIAFSPMLN